MSGQNESAKNIFEPAGHHGRDVGAQSRGREVRAEGPRHREQEGEGDVSVPARGKDDDVGGQRFLRPRGGSERRSAVPDWDAEDESKALVRLSYFCGFFFLAFIFEHKETRVYTCLAYGEVEHVWPEHRPEGPEAGGEVERVAQRVAADCLVARVVPLRKDGDPWAERGPLAAPKRRDPARLEPAARGRRGVGVPPLARGIREGQVLVRVEPAQRGCCLQHLLGMLVPHCE